jgi:nucleoside-diphosphate-sugar epimerase
MELFPPLNDFEANCLDTFKILESIRNFSPSTKFLYISSAAVYGNPKRLPVRETDGIDPISPYGWHKYYGELMGHEYTSLYGLKTSSVRPFSVYGPGLRKQLFWDLFLKSRQTNKIDLFGTMSVHKEQINANFSFTLIMKRNLQII